MSGLSGGYWTAAPAGRPTRAAKRAAADPPSSRKKPRSAGRPAKSRPPPPRQPPEQAQPRKPGWFRRPAKPPAATVPSEPVPPKQSIPPGQGWFRRSAAPEPGWGAVRGRVLTAGGIASFAKRSLPRPPRIVLADFTPDPGSTGGRRWWCSPTAGLLLAGLAGAAMLWAVGGLPGLGLAAVGAAGAWWWAGPIRRGLAAVYLHWVDRPRLQARAEQLREFAKSPLGQQQAHQPFYAMRHTKPFRTQVILRQPTSIGSSEPDISLLESKQRRLLEELGRIHGQGGLWDRVPLRASRGGLFNSTAEAVLAAPLARLFAGINVVFVNGEMTEAGMDSGGLSSEYFSLVARELVAELDQGPSRLLTRANSVPGSSAPMFKSLPDATLMLTSAGRLPLYYFALGRIAAMAVIYNCRGANCVMDISLATALRKFLVDRPIVANDVRVLDPIYYKNRIEMILQPGGVELMAMILAEDELYFVYSDADGGEGPELIQGGRQIVVTEENKQQYVALLAETYLCGDTREEIANFLHGFWDLIPLDVLQRCQVDEKDIALLLSGVPEIEVSDWMQHTTLSDGGHPEIVEWFWSVLEELPMEDRAKVLQFSTGLSRLPGGGFSGLHPEFKLTVVASRGSGSLPTAHTCFNTLELAQYDSKEALHSALGIAITEGLTGFELL